MIKINAKFVNQYTGKLITYWKMFLDDCFISWAKCKSKLLKQNRRKAMIRNRYDYPTPLIRDIKGKEMLTQNN